MENPRVGERSAKISTLNDALRRTGFGGLLCFTNGVRRYGPEFLGKVMVALEEFDDFAPENDPYGEHDFGAFMVDDPRLFWKIDYYDKSLQFGSEDPADATVTCRVLTVMLADEY